MVKYKSDVIDDDVSGYDTEASIDLYISKQSNVRRRKSLEKFAENFQIDNNIARCFDPPAENPQRLTSGTIHKTGQARSGYGHSPHKLDHGGNLPSFFNVHAARGPISAFCLHCGSQNKGTSNNRSSRVMEGACLGLAGDVVKLGERLNRWKKSEEDNIKKSETALATLKDDMTHIQALVQRLQLDLASLRMAVEKKHKKNDVISKLAACEECVTDVMSRFDGHIESTLTSLADKSSRSCVDGDVMDVENHEVDKKVVRKLVDSAVDKIVKQQSVINDRKYTDNNQNNDNSHDKNIQTEQIYHSDKKTELKHCDPRNDCLNTHQYFPVERMKNDENSNQCNIRLSNTKLDKEKVIEDNIRVLDVKVGQAKMIPEKDSIKLEPCQELNSMSQTRTNRSIRESMSELTNELTKSIGNNKTTNSNLNRSTRCAVSEEGQLNVHLRKSRSETQPSHESETESLTSEGTISEEKDTHQISPDAYYYSCRCQLTHTTGGCQYERKYKSTENLPKYNHKNHSKNAQYDDVISNGTRLKPCQNDRSYVLDKFITNHVHSKLFDVKNTNGDIIHTQYGKL